MKRLSNLYEQIISLDNLHLADEKARKGKLRSYGVKRHDRNREANILALHESLKNKTFVNSKYEVFIIRDPKERLIYRLPYYPDRILAPCHYEYSGAYMGVLIYRRYLFLH